MHQLQARITRLERQARRSRALSSVLACLLAASTLGAWLSPSHSVPELRTRKLVIEDDRGRDRIVFGAPAPSGMGTVRASPMTGFAINDTAGNERFGLGLRDSGGMTMGFDAAPGDGDPRNPERLNLGVDDEGYGFVRFLDKRTGLAGYLGLRPDDKVWMEYFYVTADSVIRRRSGLEGDQTMREAR
jgi:hypothetical protein